MFSTIKAYLWAAVLAGAGIFFAIFSSTRKENKLLKEVNKNQEESLRTVEVTEDVSTTIHVEHKIEEAAIKASTEAVKEKVRNETTSDDTPLDPEFIKLLNDSRD
jgi:hypothetical protein